MLYIRSNANSARSCRPSHYMSWFACSPRAALRHALLQGQYRSFAASYLNAYVANGAVICARFGDPERDEAARRALVRAFPGRKVVTLQIDSIADGGGGTYCLTQSVPTTSSLG